jgi:hypothetical protein
VESAAADLFRRLHQNDPDLLPAVHPDPSEPVSGRVAQRLPQKCKKGPVSDPD